MKLLFTLLLLPLTFALSAQEMIFAKMVSSVQSQYSNVQINGTVIHPDGSIFSVGSYAGTSRADSTYFGSAISGQNSFIVKYDAAGKVVSSMVISGNGKIGPTNTCIDPSGNLLLLFTMSGSIEFAGLTLNSPTITSYLIVKLDADLQVIWHRVLPQANSTQTLLSIRDIESDRYGNVLLAARVVDDYNVDGVIIGKLNSKAVLLSFDGDFGAIQWTKVITGATSSAITEVDLATDSKNNVYLQGVLYDLYPLKPFIAFSSTDTLKPKSWQQFHANFVAKYDSQGNYLSASRIDTAGYSSVGIAIDDADNLYLFGDQFLKYDKSGQLLWEKKLKGACVDGFFNRKDANYILVRFRDSLEYDGRKFYGVENCSMVLKTDLDGNVIWSSNTYAQYFRNRFYVAPNGNFALAGSAKGGYFDKYQLYDEDQLFGFWLFFADRQQPKLGNTIKGKVYEDKNLNCAYDQEPGISSYGIVALPGPIYGSSNSEGEFELSVGTGDYKVTVLPSAWKMTQPEHPCHNNTTVITFSGTGGTDSSSLFGYKYSPCTFIKPTIYRNPMVDFCFDTSVNTISLHNLSFDTVYNAVAKVKFPISVIRPTSSKPSWSSWSPSDSTITFNLGNFAPQSVRIIEIRDTVDCKFFEVPWWPKESYPITVRIEPINLCFPSDSVAQVDTARVWFQLSVGSKDLQEPAPDYHIFPNPVHEVLQIANSATKNDISELMILNVVGQPMLNRVYGYEVDYPLQVNVQDLPAGVYVLKIRTREKKLFVVKFIKS